MVKKISRFRSYKVEQILFAAGLLSGVFLAAREPIHEKTMTWAYSLKSHYLTQRLPAGGEASAATDPCTLDVGSEGVLSWQRMRLRNGNCSVYIRPSETDDMSYRGLSFGSNGGFLVFNQIGSDPRNNGSRLFYLFPRSQEVPSVNSLPELGEVAVRTGAGALIRFSTQSGHISHTSPDLSIQVASEITASNRGGIEITSWSGIILDLGFTMHEQPFYKRPTGRAIFRDARGGVCTVQNRDIFDYSNVDEPRFRLTDDGLVRAFLSQRCASLDLSSLNSRDQSALSVPEVQEGSASVAPPSSGHSAQSAQ